MVKAIVLGTETFFNFDPSEDECKQLFARVRKVPVKSLEDKTLDLADSKEMKARLVIAESGLLNIHRHCKGDASETGLVQFAESLMTLEATRKKYPVHVYKDGEGRDIEGKIPFSSDIKFNLFIRDMKADANGNLTVYIKGAPERIIGRCSKIMNGGKDVEFTQELRDEVA